ncbi:MAG: hypothetical protein ONB25_11040 [candidate division KSB1 bacterium]|nr:hypothetical protein [candidate division KSB1 bacterium]
MTVGEVNNTPDAGRPKTRQLETDKQRPGPRSLDADRSIEKPDRLEISGEARTLSVGDNQKVRSAEHPEVEASNVGFWARLLGELEGDNEPAEDRLEVIRQRLREAHYERPEVLQETARRLIEAIFGRR